MSEKRFNCVLGKDYHIINDNFDNMTYFLQERNDVVKLVEKLNEQQDIISKQLDRIIELQDKYRILEFNHSRLENRNKAQYEKIGEQQATIEEQNKQIEEWEFSFRTEMAHHRVAEKELQDKIREKQATIEQLQEELELTANTKLFSRRKLEEENEQLRQQQQRLYNYFRDYLEDEMSAENFGEMWDNVKEDERWNDE